MQAIVLAGDGINCEIETAAAAREAGFETKIHHLNDFVADKGAALARAKLLLIPGGFSFGDELGSGQILALKLKHGVGDVLDHYIEDGGAIFGICNGFQVLVRLGVFGRDVTLAANSGGRFINRWAKLEITGKSIFTDALQREGVRTIELPIRHGEGRLEVVTPALQNEFQANSQLVLRYDHDVNGAWERVAGLATKNGRVLGMMPHPEAFWTRELHPDPSRAKELPLGTRFFENAHRALK